MSTEASPTPSAEPAREIDRAEPGRRRSAVAWIIGAALIAGIGGWLGVRIHAALKTEQALASERTAETHAAEKRPAQAPSAPRIVHGIRLTWQPSLSLEGTLAPAREADLGFQVPGRLQSIRVKLGERVGAGEVLAALDSTQAAAQVQAAEAQVRAAEAQLALASDSAHRTSRLVGSGAASQAVGVQVSQQQSLAQAQLDGARAQLALAKSALQNHTLTAPFSGSVTRVPAGTGAIVSPGVPLFHLADTSTLKLNGTVGAADAALIKPGAEVAIREGGETLSGKVTAVLQAVDPATRRVPVEATVKNDGPHPLLGGVFVRAAIEGLRPIEVVRVPAEALRPGSQDELMVVKDGRLEARRITFAHDAEGALLVRAGLQPDDAVLLSPSAEAQDGDQVDLRELAAQGRK